MDLVFLNQTEYILEAWKKYTADDPAALALTDERHHRGLSRRQVDELSGRVYAWLKGKTSAGKTLSSCVCPAARSR